MKFTEIIADLEGWQTQLAARAIALKQDQDAFDKLKASIRETVRDHTKDVVVSNKSKQGVCNTSVPTSSVIRGMIHKVLTAKTRVSMRELISRVHILAGMEVPEHVSDSLLTPKIYSTVKTVKTRKLIKGTRKGFSLTVLGRPGNNRWA